jgi:pyridoxamine 5'-phosphate oxidase
MNRDGILTAKDPFVLLANWMQAAAISEPRDAGAAQLATVDKNGLPNVRTVLIQAWGEKGFVFYTNYRSAKGKELIATRKAALLYYWKSMSRQIRVRGAIEPVDEDAANAYFASRPRGSQISAHASLQSRPLTDRRELERRRDACEKRFEGAPVPRPSHWSGFRLVPFSIEFWQERPFRLHDRLEFRRQGNSWRRRFLYP